MQQWFFSIGASICASGKTNPITVVTYGKFGKEPAFVLACRPVRSAIAFPSTKSWHCYPTKHTKTLHEKQWNTKQCDKSQHIVTCLAVFRLHMHFSLVQWLLGMEKGAGWRFWWLPLTVFLINSKLCSPEARPLSQRVQAGLAINDNHDYFLSYHQTISGDWKKKFLACQTWQN